MPYIKPGTRVRVMEGPGAHKSYWDREGTVVENNFDWSDKNKETYVELEEGGSVFGAILFKNYQLQVLEQQPPFSVGQRVRVKQGDAESHACYHGKAGTVVANENGPYSLDSTKWTRVLLDGDKVGPLSFYHHSLEPLVSEDFKVGDHVTIERKPISGTIEWVASSSDVIRINRDDKPASSGGYYVSLADVTSLVVNSSKPEPPEWRDGYSVRLLSNQRVWTRASRSDLVGGVDSYPWKQANGVNEWPDSQINHYWEKGEIEILGQPYSEAE